MLLTIIIVNYNVKHYLYQCLESLRRAGQGLDWEVFVVDNNSTDGSVEYLQALYPQSIFPQLRIVANKENLGFGRANNQAFLMSEGDYVLYLNPDTFVGEGMLRDTLSFMQSHPDAGCLGVKMLNADGSFAMESRRGVPTPWVSFCKISRLSKLFPHNKKFGRYYMQHLPIDKPNPIDIVSGACMMVKRSVVEKVGIFDDDYFMYCEDTDMAYRMLLNGYHNYYLPTPILHYKGESSKRYSYSFTNMFYKAILIFFRKHFNHHFFFLQIIIYIALYVLAILSFLRWQYRNLCYKISNTFFPHQPKLLCLTSQTNEATLREIASHHNLSSVVCLDIVNDSLQLDHLLQTHKPDYIVYDTTLYGNEQILDITHRITTKRKSTIATFFPERQMILTNTYIFTL